MHASLCLSVQSIHRRRTYCCFVVFVWRYFLVVALCNSMSKLFVIPDVGGSTSFSCIQCKHPKDGSVCTYYYEPKQNRLYELAVQQNRFYSWFLNNNLNNGTGVAIYYFIFQLDAFCRW